MSIEIALTKERNRPRERAASNVSGDRHHGTRLELILNLDHETDELDLGGDVWRSDRFAVDTVRDLPPGTLLRVVVGRRVIVTEDALEMLHELKSRGVHIMVMAETIESGTAWTSRIDGRQSA